MMGPDLAEEIITKIIAEPYNLRHPANDYPYDIEVRYNSFINDISIALKTEHHKTPLVDIELYGSNLCVNSTRDSTIELSLADPKLFDNLHTAIENAINAYLPSPHTDTIHFKRVLPSYGISYGG